MKKVNERYFGGVDDETVFLVSSIKSGEEPGHFASRCLGMVWCAEGQGQPVWIVSDGRNLTWLERAITSGDVKEVERARNSTFAHRHLGRGLWECRKVLEASGFIAPDGQPGSAIRKVKLAETASFTGEGHNGDLYSEGYHYTLRTVAPAKISPVPA